jgi:hypothetical protein
MILGYTYNEYMVLLAKSGMIDLGVSPEPGSLQPGLASQACRRNEPIRPI